MLRFSRIAATLIGIGALTALSVVSAIPASAQGSDIIIRDASSYQYYLYCDENQTPPTCNLQGSEELDFPVWNADGGAAQTVAYTIINGTAVDGIGFDIPMTGWINVPANGSTGGFFVPVINASGQGTTGTFTVVLGTTARATGTIMPGAEVPSDCSLSATNNVAISMTCTNRPSGETWYAWAWCLNWDGYQIREGNHVTGDGTSTVNCELYPPLDGAEWFAG